MKEITVLEEIVLTTILRLKENAYGVAIRKKVGEITNRNLIYGTLYNILDQLLRKGYVQKTRGAPTAERGGRSKLYYRLTSSGIRALQESRKLHNQIWEGLQDIIAE